MLSEKTPFVVGNEALNQDLCAWFQGTASPRHTLQHHLEENCFSELRKAKNTELRILSSIGYQRTVICMDRFSFNRQGNGGRQTRCWSPRIPTKLMAKLGTDPGSPNAESSRAAAALTHPGNCLLNTAKLFPSSACCVSSWGRRSDSKYSKVNSSALALSFSWRPNARKPVTVISGTCLHLQ